MSRRRTRETGSWCAAKGQTRSKTVQKLTKNYMVIIDILHVNRFEVMYMFNDCAAIFGSSGTSVPLLNAANVQPLGTSGDVM